MYVVSKFSINSIDNYSIVKIYQIIMKGFYDYYMCFFASRLKDAGFQ